MPVVLTESPVRTDFQAKPLSWFNTQLGEEIQVHQDQRIGLALAVLLIGAAGAFCFRNDSKPAGTGPRLKSTRELDARIAEKSIAPYLQSSDEDHEGTGITARKVSDRSKSTETGGDHSLPRLDTPDFLNSDDRQPAPWQAGRSGDGVQELAPIPFPELNGNGASSIAGHEPTDTTGKTAAAGERIHVVQKGETLSSIAAKVMGSSNRFQDLFDANRDQLSDANDVRVGMSLRVPPRRVARADATTPRTKDRPSQSAPPLLPVNSNRGDAAEMPAINADPDKQAPSPAKKKFEPAKRPPLGIKSLGTQSSELEPQNKPNRKLTQLPPKDSGGKIAR